MHWNRRKDILFLNFRWKVSKKVGLDSFSLCLFFLFWRETSNTDCKWLFPGCSWAFALRLRPAWSYDDKSTRGLLEPRRICVGFRDEPHPSLAKPNYQYLVKLFASCYMEQVRLDLTRDHKKIAAIMPSCRQQKTKWELIFSGFSHTPRTRLRVKHPLHPWSSLKHIEWCTLAYVFWWLHASFSRSWHATAVLLQVQTF